MVSGGLDAKVEYLSAAACDEVSIAEPRRVLWPDLSGSIYRAARRGGHTSLLKVLLSNACENDCAYCANRSSASVPRATLKPDELARTFDEMRQAGLVEGLFLSSGLCGNAARTMDRLLDTVEIVRGRYRFDGYVHLKVLPGASADQIERAGSIADRVSVNLEAPNRRRLSLIAPDKPFDALVSIVDQIKTLQQRSVGAGLPRPVVAGLPRPYAPAGQTTQFVAGAAGESDSELLGSAALLYGRYALRRVYYSGYRPVEGTPLEGVPAMPRRRQSRLYQADALLRGYGFEPGDLPFDEGGELPQDCDPKLAWAARHPEHFPVELNTAGRQALLRVPGIGPTGAERILRLRGRCRLKELRQLAKLGVAGGRCASFVLLDGRRPEQQLPLPLP